MASNSTKNATNIASLMGSWTARLDIKTDIGDNELQVYFVVHFMPNPMSQYGCYLEHCSEIENNICMKPRHNGYGEKPNRCEKMEDIMTDWSDIVAFVNMGGTANANTFNVHQSMSTGGWVGPYSLMMAQNKTADDEYISSSKGKMKVLDRYETRWVYSESTPYLRVNPGCDILDPSEFDGNLGATAVNNTVTKQVTNPFANGVDPYARYLNTCDNGNLQPILPLAEFTFVEDHESDQGISIEFKINYKVITFLPEGPARAFLKHLVRKGKAPISGPYCYMNDPTKSYTIDVAVDSTKGEGLIKVAHACIEGFPCTPESAAYSSTAKQIQVDIQDGATVIELGPIVCLAVTSGLLFVGLLVSLFINCKRDRKIKQLKQAIENIEPEMEMEESNALHEPLLD